MVTFYTHLIACYINDTAGYKKCINDNADAAAAYNVSFISGYKDWSVSLSSYKKVWICSTYHQESIIEKRVSNFNILHQK